MTETPKPLAEQHVSERSMRPAALKCCIECPFKKENFNTEHPSGQYTAKGITEKWRNVSQNGAVFGCHLFDAELLAYDEEMQNAGFRAPANIGGRRECTGMAAMIGRELTIAAECESYDEYHAKRPLGLSREALTIHLSRYQGKHEPKLRLSEHINEADIADPTEIVDPDSWEWKISRTGAAKLLLTMEALFPELRACACVVCTRHSEVHDAKSLRTAEGQDVEVDAALHPLLTAMAGAQIRTTDSCINVREAVTELNPGYLANLMNASNRATLNYESALRRDAAFIRMRHDNNAEKVFLLAAAEAPGVEVTTSGLLTQIVFDAATIPHLTRITDVIRAAIEKGRP